jgi:subtilisin family serine protease
MAQKKRTIGKKATAKSTTQTANQKPSAGVGIARQIAAGVLRTAVLNITKAGIKSATEQATPGASRIFYVYIGINDNQPHFVGAAGGKNAIVATCDCTKRGFVTTWPATDAHGHGTHVAGIIAGRFKSKDLELWEWHRRRNCT